MPRTPCPVIDSKSPARRRGAPRASAPSTIASASGCSEPRSSAAAKILIDRGEGGKIVNFSSLAARVGGIEVGVHYAASKAGLIGLTKTVAKELGSRNITVNVVAPGFVLTDLTADLSEDLVNKMLEFIPLGRWGELQEIANVVTFLASDKASYITGEVIQVDGGIAI